MCKVGGPSERKKTCFKEETPGGDKNGRQHGKAGIIELTNYKIE